MLVITTTIPVAPVPPDIPEYGHSQWKHWTDADGDCQDTRQEVLVQDSLSEAAFQTDGRCRVETGWWHGDFTRKRVNDPSELDMDYRVPLQNAHRSGGWAWPADKKEEYANYLDVRLHLVAVTASANRSKGKGTGGVAASGRGLLLRVRPDLVGGERQVETHDEQGGS